MKGNRVVSSLILSLLLPLLLPAVGVAREIGVFLEHQPDCVIRSSSGDGTCDKDVMISSGDIIRTKRPAAALNIQWSAPECIELTPVASGQYRVTFTPPERKNVALGLLQNFLGFTRKAGRISRSAVTRGVTEHQPILPGEGATLVPGRPVTFSWCAPGVKKIVLTTPAGVKVKEVAVAVGERTLVARPEDLGLRAGESYRWFPAGAVSQGGTLSVLEDAAAQQLMAALSSLKEGNGSTAANALRQAAYLQLVSQTDPDRYALGWWQYGRAREAASGLSGDDQAAAFYLEAQGAGQFCE